MFKHFLLLPLGTQIFHDIPSYYYWDFSSKGQRELFDYKLKTNYLIWDEKIKEKGEDVK